MTSTAEHSSRERRLKVTEQVPANPIQKVLRRVDRTPVHLDGTEKLRREPLLRESGLVLLIACSEPLDFVSWLAKNRDFIEDSLVKHGGILFRNFRVGDLADFQRFVNAASDGLLKYSYRSTPRTELGGNIYSSTEYPSSEHIPLHNENSYAHTWPMKIFFYCEKPADEGGRTPLADSGAVFDLISSRTRDRFIERQVMYVRNYGGGADLSWQEVFQAEDPEAVEQFCRHAGIGFEWREGGRLRTRQVCPAATKHPKTGKMVWFNQAHLFHLSSLAPALQISMLEVFEREEELPRNAFYGDGSQIESEALEEIRAAYQKAQISFDWQRGDVLLLDNMAVAHGRTPYKGDRKVRVAMTEPMGLSRLAL
jgi:alpha-ketoglutarate-dependent taurine dioxygenase